MLALLACTCSSDPVPTDESLAESARESVGESAETADSEAQEVVDPGWPTFPATVDVLHVTMRPTEDSEYSGTDDTLALCLTPEVCVTLAKPDWNDNEHGVVDVHIEEDLGLDRSELSALSWTIDDGGDQYRPACMAVSLDGEPWHCRNDYEVKLGTDDMDELPVLNEDVQMQCMGCWDTPLSHGPMTSTDSTGTRFWIRTDATRRVLTYVNEVLVHIGYPVASEDFAHEVFVEGLQPPYSYRFEIDEVPVGPWSVQDPSAEGYRVAFGSCSKDDDQPIFGAIRSWDPDAFLFIGDNHYANSNDLGALRAWYRWAHERSGRAELMAEASVYATWDDHDYVGNNTDHTSEGGDVAKRVFDEYWANTIPARHVLGDAELFLVDDRTYRGLDDTLLGAEQTAWLTAALGESTATWKLVASGSQFTQEGSSDSWAAYPEDYAAFLESVSDVSGLVFLSGDIHRSEFRLLPGPSYDIPELTSSPLATWNSPCQDESQLECEDDGDFFIGMVVTPETLTATMHSDDGGVLHAWVIEASTLQP